MMKTYFSVFQRLTCWPLAALLLLTGPALAVDELNLFELDGNAVEPNNAGDLPGDDWQTLLNGGGNASAFTGIKADPAPNTIFDGGKKDIQDISQWSGKDGSVPDKSDITNAYAASYICPAGQLGCETGDLIVYFGADRVANAGDTFLGFWFFKANVGFDPITGKFSGAHQPGDVLVLVNFPQAANAVPEIKAVEWDTSCLKADSNNPQVNECAAKNLRLRAGAAGDNAVCKTDGSGSQLQCAIANEGGTPNAAPGVDASSPWAYVSKDGFVDEFPFETFFEGGINLSEVIGGDACFASFMAETRSSSSFTASLKDFALDAFPVCSISVDKACTNPRLNASEDMIIYDVSGTVTNDGFGTVYNVSVSDRPVAFDAGSLAFSPASGNLSLAGGASVDYSATITVPLLQNGLTDQVTATANTAADNGGTLLTADSGPVVCPSLQISPALSLTKNCEASVTVMNATVVAQVTASGTVCNIGDTKISNVSVVDDKAGTLLSGQTLLAPADPADPGATTGACKNYSGTYTPSVSNDINNEPTTVPGEVVFKDTATANGTDIFNASVGQQQVMASCPLCD